MRLTGDIDRRTLILFGFLGVLMAGGVIWCVFSWIALGQSASRVERAREDLSRVFDASSDYEKSLAGTGSFNPMASSAGEFSMVYYMSNLLATGITDKRITPSPLDEEEPHHYREGYVEYRYHFTYTDLSFPHAIGIWYLLEADSDPRVKINRVRVEPVAKTDSRSTTYTYTVTLSLSHFSPSREK